MHQFTQTQLEEKSRKEIQALAKELGLKANAATNVIITSILQLYPASESSQEVQLPSEITSVAQSPVNEKETIATIESARIMDVTVEETLEKEYEIGSNIEIFHESMWKSASIKRINKKSIRVSILDSGVEVTAKLEDCRWPLTTKSQSISDDIIENVSESVPLTQDVAVVPEDTQSESMVETQIPEDTHETPIKPSYSEITPFTPCDAGVSNEYGEIEELEEPESKDMDLVESILIAPTPAPSQISRKRKSIEIRRSLTRLTQTLENINSTKKPVPVTSAIEIRSVKMRPESSQKLSATKQNTAVPTSNSNLKSKLSSSNGSSTGNRVLDFQKLHASTFRGQKSITAIVARKESVVLNMEKAMANAQLGVVPERDGHHIASTIPSVKPNPAVTKQKADVTVQFKARPMPNFKVAHEKSAAKLVTKPKTPQPLHSAQTKNKENTNTTESENSNNAPTVSTDKMDTKREERKSMFMEKKRTDRMNAFLAARRSIGTPNSKAAFSGNSVNPKKFPSSPKPGFKTAENPFHYCN